MDTPKDLRIVFAGTPDFALASLTALIDAQFTVIATYTQPDRPAGRGRKLTSSPVKNFALKHNIPVYQPISLRDNQAQDELRALSPDLMVVAAYGLILPQAVLDIPTYGCINVHSSRLPKWRGAAPIQHAILAGDSDTGVTIIKMDAGMDTGDELYHVACPITNIDTGGSLHDKLAALGASALIDTLNDISNKLSHAKPQDHEQATYAGKIAKKDAQIDWNKPVANVHRLIRAFNPWPIAHTHYKSDLLRVWSAEVLNTFPVGQHKPGTILGFTKHGLDIACKDGCIRLTELQLPSKSRQNIEQFFRPETEKWLKTGDVLSST